MMLALGNNSFLRYKTSGFTKFPLTNLYVKEKEKLKKEASSIHVTLVLRNANVIGDHFIYKFKVN